MNFQKVTFTNKEGEQLVGRLELPIDQRPHNFAVFAHCFTCSKNLISIRNIARELIKEGFGVLRFDFTGLGESEGDFADTNFSGNVEDLVAAANFLKENYTAPTLIIGHSLGGSAALFAAEQVSSIKAVAVINSPSNPKHVKRLVKDDIDTIIKNGKAQVNVGGRDFTIKKQFLDDLESHPLKDVVANFGKSLLVLHSPQDTIVGIENAKELFTDAWHPKSYISLDGMDHMISGKENSQYVGKIIAGWAMRYVSIPEKEQLRTTNQVAASLDHIEKFTTVVKLGDHSMLADEPTSYGGNNFGPSPYEFLSGALASCTAMTVQMYARRKKWHVENITVHIDHSKEHAVDCKNSESSSAKIDTFTKKIKLTGDLTDKQKKRLMEIADRCPVHRTLMSEIQILSSQIE